MFSWVGVGSALELEGPSGLGEVPVGFTLSHRHQLGVRTQKTPPHCGRFCSLWVLGTAT